MTDSRHRCASEFADDDDSTAVAAKKGDSVRAASSSLINNSGDCASPRVVAARDSSRHPSRIVSSLRAALHLLISVGARQSAPVCQLDAAMDK